MTFNPSTILVTGGCGFIGANFIKEILSLDKGTKLINFDALTYAGNLDSLADVSWEWRPRR